MPRRKTINIKSARLTLKKVAERLKRSDEVLTKTLEQEKFSDGTNNPEASKQESALESLDRILGDSEKPKG